MRDVFVIGAGQTPVSRSEPTDLSELGATAIGAALQDAQIEPAIAKCLYVGNMVSGILSSQLQLGSLLADYAGIPGIEALTVEAACASGAAAARMGFLAVAGGVHDIVVVCGVEKLAHAHRTAVTSALATATDWKLEGGRDESFISLNADLMRRYIEKYRVHQEDFAPFSIVAHQNAMHNPNAVFHRELDTKTYLESRLVHDPLRLYDVSPICDGAAAIVLASAEIASEAARAARGKVQIAASSIATAPPALVRREDPLYLEAIEVATRQVLQSADLRLADIDLFELHDAYTIMTVLSLEAAGFAKPGRGIELGTSGRVALDGDVPIATFGGLKARGHPVGATGVYQLAEAFLQLTERAGRNQVRDASTALVQNIGGTASTVINHILRRR